VQIRSFHNLGYVLEDFLGNIRKWQVWWLWRNGRKVNASLQSSVGLQVTLTLEILEKDANEDCKARAALPLVERRRWNLNCRPLFAHDEWRVILEVEFGLGEFYEKVTIFRGSVVKFFFLSVFRTIQGIMTCSENTACPLEYVVLRIFHLTLVQYWCGIGWRKVSEIFVTLLEKIT